MLCVPFVCTGRWGFLGLGAIDGGGCAWAWLGRLCGWGGGFGFDDSAAAGEVLCVEGCPVFPGLEPVCPEQAAPPPRALDVWDLVVAGHFVDCAHRAVQSLGDVFCCQVRGATHGAGASVPGGGAPPRSRSVGCSVSWTVPTVPSAPVGSSVLPVWLAGLEDVAVGWRVRGCRRCACLGGGGGHRGVSLGGCAGR